VSAASPACSRSSPQWKRSPPTATGDPPRAPARFARPAHARRASISGHPTFHSLRQLGLLGARQFTYVALAGCEQIVGADASDSDPAAHDEADHPLGLDAVEAEVAGERGDRSTELAAGPGSGRVSAVLPPPRVRCGR
jgi:hypothetical protein